MKLNHHRLKTLRLARGLSLAELSVRMEGLVTKQALSKYEKGEIQPSPSVVRELASSLEVKIVELARVPQFSFEKLEFRKKSSLGKKAAEAIQATIEEEFHRRLQLQEKLSERLPLSIPIRHYNCDKVVEAEHAARDLRNRLNLGADPIANLTAVLEEWAVHIIYLDAPESFDGYSTLARDGDDNIRSAAAASRTGVPGDRQRLTIAHELGHLVLRRSSKLSDKENELAAFRFGAAFLVPGETLIAELGRKRSSLNLGELLILKHRFGVSVQALVRRARDLTIISEPAYKSVCMQMSRMQWRTKEPGKPYLAEESTWTKQHALRAWTEGLLTLSEAEEFLGEIPDEASASGFMRRKAFLKLPSSQRNAILAEEAKKFAALYDEPSDWDAIATEGWE